MINLFNKHPKSTLKELNEDFQQGKKQTIIKKS